MPSSLRGMRQTSPPWHIAMPSGGGIHSINATGGSGADARDASRADLGGDDWAKPVPPEPDGLMADIDATLGQQILDVAQGYPQPDCRPGAGSAGTEPAGTGGALHGRARILRLGGLGFTAAQNALVF